MCWNTKNPKQKCKEIKKFCKDFEWLKNFYIQIELLALTSQQQEQTKRNLILFNKYYKNVLKNAIELCKLPQNK